MINNYYTLRYVAASLDGRLSGARILEAFSQERDEVVLRFEDKDEHLVISCRGETSTLYLHSRFSRKKRNATDVLHSLPGKKIESISIAPMDRRVLFRLQEETLEAQFFGNKSNVLLLGADGSITDAFRDARNLVGTTVNDSRIAEDSLDLTLFDRALEENRTTPVLQVLRKSLPQLGQRLAAEVLFRAQIQPGITSEQLGPSDILQAKNSLLTLLGDLDTPQPRVYFDEMKTTVPSLFSLIHLSHLAGREEKQFDDVHEAIRFFLSRSRASSGFAEEHTLMVNRIGDRLEKLRRTVGAIDKDLEQYQRADEYERYGGLLLAAVREIKKGERTFTVRQEYADTTIPLSPKLTPIQNAQSYFEKAKTVRSARRQSEMRVAGLRPQIALGEQLISALGQLKTSEELNNFMTANEAQLGEFGIGKKQEEREQIPFRIFTVDGGFEVWAGKSSQNNDLLTTKYAKPNDLWFHARGSSGSHVILRTHTGKGEPGKKAREQAASIAAYYSKMKNAKMVPVAMTEKKYVRKPKGAHAGTVTLEREKVIFAEPCLPENQQD